MGELTLEASLLGYLIASLWFGYRALRFQGTRPWSVNEWRGAIICAAVWPLFMLDVCWRAINLIIDDGIRRGF